MAEGRPAVSSALERSLKVETGHRCAIPTCRQTPIELAHIEPWSKVKTHSFENMIALCRNCHAKFDRGEIDRKSMHIYKANLTILNARYGDLERRIFELFAQNPRHTHVEIPASLQILLKYACDDGLVELRQHPVGSVAVMGMQVSPVLCLLTQRGREFVRLWVNARDIE